MSTALLPSNFSLYDIHEHLAALFESEECCPDDRRAELDNEIQAFIAMELTKVDSIASYLAWLEQQAEFAAAEIKRLQARKKASENRHARIEMFVSKLMQLRNYTRLDGRTTTLSLRRAPPSVEVVDERAVPAEFQIIKTETSVDKTKVKTALQAGTLVPGARLISDKTYLVRR